MSVKYLSAVCATALLLSLNSVGRCAESDASKPTVAVFSAVVGDVAKKDAGQALSDGLLGHLAQRYSPVDSARLKTFLEEAGVPAGSLPELAAGGSAATKLATGAKLRGVKYMVVASLWSLPKNRLWVTAGLIDWQKGTLLRAGQVSGESWDDLQRRFPDLAAQLSPPGGEAGKPALPPLPKELMKIEARIQQGEALGAALNRALETMPEKSEWALFLQENFQRTGKQLVTETEGKIKELQVLDIMLVEEYSAEHPESKANADQVANYRKCLEGGYLSRITPPKYRTVDIVKGVPMKFAVVPSGEFLMGSPASEEGRGADEGPQHIVAFHKSFLMGAYEVTQAQYEAVMGTNPSHFKGPTLPVDSVTPENMEKFFRRVLRGSGRRLRLPTEAEWEYACRADSRTPFSTGSTISGEAANYDATYVYGSGKAGEYRMQTAPVGSFKPNAWGLYDMHGNVWEWCSDRYGKYVEGESIIPAGTESGDALVQRGGAWVSYPRDCRSACRSRGEPLGGGSSAVGFRIVYVPEEDVATNKLDAPDAEEAMPANLKDVWQTHHEGM